MADQRSASRLVRPTTARPRVRAAGSRWPQRLDRANPAQRAIPGRRLRTRQVAFKHRNPDRIRAKPSTQSAIGLTASGRHARTRRRADGNRHHHPGAARTPDPGPSDRRARGLARIPHPRNRILRIPTSPPLAATYDPTGIGHGVLHEDGHHPGDTVNIYAHTDGLANADQYTVDATWEPASPPSSTPTARPSSCTRAPTATAPTPWPEPASPAA